MCHTSCLELNAGPLPTYLSTITTWLKSNPNEVLTLLLVNGDGVSVSMFGDAFVEAGLDGFAYAPGRVLSLDEWPTLQELIDAGNRLVVFLGRLFGFGLVRAEIDQLADCFDCRYWC